MPSAASCHHRLSLRHLPHHQSTPSRLSPPSCVASSSVALKPVGKKGRDLCEPQTQTQSVLTATFTATFSVTFSRRFFFFATSIRVSECQLNLVSENCFGSIDRGPQFEPQTLRAHLFLRLRADGSSIHILLTWRLLGASPLRPRGMFAAALASLSSQATVSFDLPHNNQSREKLKASFSFPSIYILHFSTSRDDASQL